MSTIARTSRLILLGPEQGPAARFACGRRAILGLALLAICLHGLDLLSGIRLMALYGLDQEQNPLARLVFASGGPTGLSLAKASVVTAGVLVLVRLAELGRPRLARNSLVVIGLLGLLGFASNLV